MTRSNTGPAPGPGCARPGWARLTPVALRAPYVTRAGEKAPFSPKMGRSGNQEIRNIEVLTIARRRCKVKIEPHPPLISVKQESRLKCQGCVRSRKTGGAEFDRVFVMSIRFMSGFAIAFSACAWGQVTTATIYGTVLDSSGAAVPSASITITPPQQNLWVAGGSGRQPRL